MLAFGRLNAGAVDRLDMFHGQILQKMVWMFKRPRAGKELLNRWSA
jgi:hypothetical protein